MNNALPMRIIARERGGWLALTGRTFPLRIGVTAETEQLAKDRLQRSVDEWGRNLAKD